MRVLLTAMFGLALSAFAFPASADVAGRYETRDKNAPFKMEMTIETNDAGDARLQMAGQANYFLLKSGVLYTVGRGESGPIVERVADMLAVQADTMRRIGLSDQLADAAGKAPQPEFAKIGPENVGPWQGNAFGFKSDTGKPGPYAAFVMSDDPRIAPLGKAILAMNGDMMGAMGNMLPGFGQFGQAFMQFLSNGTPVRMLNIELTDVSYDPISPERFALPATPLTLEQLRAQAQPFPEPPTLPIRKK